MSEGKDCPTFMVEINGAARREVTIATPAWKMVAEPLTAEF